MAFNLLLILPMLTEYKRIFSLVKLAVLDQRCSANEDTIGKLVCLKVW